MSYTKKQVHVYMFVIKKQANYIIIEFIAQHTLSKQ